MVTAITKIVPPDRFYHFLNAWFPGFICEIIFLVLYYEQLNLDEVTINYFGVDPTITFIIMFICFGGVIGYVLNILGTIPTRQINKILFRLSKKVSFADSDRIDQTLKPDIYREVEDAIIIQVFLSEVGIIVLIMAGLSIVNSFNAITFFIYIFLAIFLFSCNIFQGKCMVTKYEHLNEQK